MKLKIDFNKNPFKSKPDKTIENYQEKMRKLFNNVWYLPNSKQPKHIIKQ